MAMMIKGCGLSFHQHKVFNVHVYSEWQYDVLF